MGGIRVITGDVIFDLPFYNAKGILTGGDIYGPRLNKSCRFRN